MLISNKTILLPNIQAINDILNSNDNENLYNCKCIYENRIAIQHLFNNNINTIRIWRTKSLFDYWYDNFDNCGKNVIASLDYTINELNIQIDHLFINDSDQNKLYNNPLDEYEAEDLINTLINFLKIIAKKNFKPKIIFYVHENLKLFLKYYYYLGFQTTDRKCKQNPFWIETEINIEF
jgi:hypothetical protein